MHPETYTEVLQQHPDMPDELREHVSRLAMEAGEFQYPSVQAPEYRPVDARASTVRVSAKHGKPAGHHMGAVADVIRGASVLEPAAGPYENYARHSLNNITDGVRAFADGKFSFIEESNNYSYNSWEDMAAAALEYVQSAPTREERRDGLSQFIQSVNYLWEGPYSSSEAVQDQTTAYTVAALQALRFDDRLTPDIQDIYFNHTDESSEALRNLLVQLQGRKVSNPGGDERFSMSFLGTMYGDESLLNLCDKARQSVDPTLARILTADGAKRHIVNAELGHNIDASKYKPPEIANIQRETAQRLLGRLAPNLPRAAAQDLLFASYSRTEPEDFKDYEARKALLDEMLVEVIETTDKLGPSAVKQLYDHAGIVNFDYYAVNQLEMMNKIIGYDRETLEHLDKGDVTVVFIDALGDHNGAMKPMSSIYAKPSGRTLFFEIHKPENYNQYKTFLRTRGIKPSTVVFVNHGEPGNLLVGPDGRGYAITNEQEEPISNKGTSRKKHSILSIVDNLRTYMKPSRGIDDPYEAIGYMRVIMNACSQDKAVPQTLTTPEREPVTETVARITGPGTVVYGGNEVIYIEGTSQGLRMGGAVYQPDGSLKDIGYIPISVVEVDAYGRIRRDRVDELTLRQKGGE